MTVRNGIPGAKGKKLLAATLMLFIYGVFWIVLATVTLAFAPGILGGLSSAGLIPLSRWAAIIAIVISCLYIVSGGLVFLRRISGVVMAFILVVITEICNVALLVIGLGLFPFVTLGLGLLSASFLIIGGLGAAINFLIALFLGPKWENFRR